MTGDDDIAIVGVGCKFPGANNVDEFWRVLKNGENHVIEVPKSRWNLDAYYDPDPRLHTKTNVRRAGFVEGIDEWDYQFYGISPKEAEAVDPQQRMVLDCVHMAMEDGGITRKAIAGSQTGVYIGCTTDDYKELVDDIERETNVYTVTGSHPSIISARVSYVYNLVGPAMTLDTACSSALVAIDVGSRAILSGTCQAAICGGVNLLLNPKAFVILSKTRMLSPSGQCKTFSKDANGYARGEGCGIVILKKLKDAIRDGNKIWATIKTETNQDGRFATPITAPAPEQQVRLLEDVYARYQIDKEEIQVIEAHGTGTFIGDPSEAAALGYFFGDKPTHVRYLGSVKTNIGHLESASAAAGLIKVLLMLRHKCVVPSLWYSKENENPKLELASFGFEVPTESKDWDFPGGRKKVACVNSFGFGGTNAHAIVEEYRQRDDDNTAGANGLFPIVTLSAFEKETLLKNVKQLQYDLQRKDYDLHDLSYTSACRRDHLPHRNAFAAKSQSELIEQCAGFTSGIPDAFSFSENKRIIFVFCGVGTVWQGMCSWLRKHPVFSKAIDDIDCHLDQLAGWKIRSKLLDPNIILADNPMVAHIAIFACQVGLVALWKHIGVIPQTVIGQSVGEVAAALTSGAIDMETAVKIIYYRSKLLAEENSGTMAVIRSVAVQNVENYCRGRDNLSVAVVSSPVSCTVSGTREEIEKMRQHFYSDKADVIHLNVKCAYHSPFVQKAANEIATAIGPISIGKPSVPMISTVTADVIDKKDVANADYWEQNVRCPVRFADAIKKARQESAHNIYVEIGPNAVLHAHLQDIFPDDNKVSAVLSDRRNTEENTFVKSVCRLYEFGCDLNWENIVPQRTKITDIPTYQFHKNKTMFLPESAVRILHGIPKSCSSHPYVRLLANPGDRFEFGVQVNLKTAPYVYEHFVTGHNILPGAFYADVGFEVGMAAYQLNKERLSLALEFLRPVRIDKGNRITFHTLAHKEGTRIYFNVSYDNFVVCKGWVYPTDYADDSDSEHVNVQALQTAIKLTPHHVTTGSEIYHMLEEAGFVYGESFQLIKLAVYNAKESLSKVELPDSVLKDTPDLHLHPCVLDSMLQSTIFMATEDLRTQFEGKRLSFLPTGMKNIRLYKQPVKQMFIYTKLMNVTILQTVIQIHFNILLTDTHGTRIAEINNFTSYSKQTESQAPCDLSYKLTWQPVSVDIPVEKEPKVLVITVGFSEEETKPLQKFDFVDCLRFAYGEITLQSSLPTIFNGRNGKRQIDSTDAIVLLLKGSPVGLDFSEAVAQNMYQTILTNCMNVAEMLRYFTKIGAGKPLYLVTENTQEMQSKEHGLGSSKLLGSEMWGLVRSIYSELVYSKITLVDVQPSLHETADKLIEFISKTFEKMDDTGTEVIIQQDTVNVSCLLRIPKCQPIPKTRRMSPKGAQNEEEPLLLHSSHSSRLGDISLYPVSGSPKIDKKDRSYIRLKLKSVTIPPSFIHKPTTPGRQMDQDVWEETYGKGHPVFAFEFTGYAMTGNKSSKPFCGDPVPPNMNASGQWEWIALHPSAIQTEMFVPKSLAVCRRELPFYEHGMLIYSMVFWKIMESIPKKKNVSIFWPSASDKLYKLFSTMLVTMKQANIQGSKESSTKTTDVFVAMENISEWLGVLPLCSQLVCLQSHLSADDSLALQITTGQALHVINTEEIFTIPYLEKNIHCVVKWLKSSRKALSEMSIQSVQEKNGEKMVTLPCESVEILTSQGQYALPLMSPLQTLFSKSATYVVTGGLTGVGWEFTVLMAEMGAGVIATLSRRVVPAETQRDIDMLEKRTGCKIVSLQGTVNDISSLRNAFQKLVSISKGRPIKGLFHGAGVLDNAQILEITKDQMETVLKPKVLGTMNLHIVSREMKLPLEYFVVTSSVNALLGSPGQSNYGAANSFMDSFMMWRRENHLVGQAINWGALAVGMASLPNFTDNFLKRGINLLSVEEIRSCFLAALLQNTTGTVYTDINWDMTKRLYTVASMKRIKLQLSVVMTESTSSALENDTLNYDFDVEMIKKGGPEKQRLAVTELVRQVTSRVINTDVSCIKPECTPLELGFDSMATVTFINVVHSITGYRIPVALFMETSNTLSILIDHLHRTIFGTSRSVGGFSDMTSTKKTSDVSESTHF